MANVNVSANKSDAKWSVLLFIVLLILKVDPGQHLTSEVTGWSWWLITAPLWAPVVFILGVLAVIALFGGIALVFTGIDHLYQKTGFARKRRAKKMQARLRAKRARYGHTTNINRF